MAKHTPGPWGFYPADYRRGPGDLLPIFVVGPAEFTTVANVRPGSEDDDLPKQTEANASLISAAPDLLAALKLCAAVASGDTMTKSGLIKALEAARDAIAKAEGQP